MGLAWDDNEKVLLRVNLAENPDGSIVLRPPIPGRDLTICSRRLRPALVNALRTLDSGGTPRRYWRLDGSTVRAMTGPERAAHDARVRVVPADPPDPPR